MEHCAQTERYRQQHDSLRQIAGDTSTSAAQMSEAKARSVLIRLIGSLRAHLGLERCVSLSRNAREFRSGATSESQTFQQEIGGLAQAVDAFHRKWSLINAIDNDREGFLSDWIVVRKALSDRMSGEDDDLYAILDRASLRKSA